MKNCVFLGTGKFAQEIAHYASVHSDHHLLCAWKSAAIEHRHTISEPGGFRIGALDRLIEFLAAHRVSRISFAGHVSMRRDFRPLDTEVIEKRKGGGRFSMYAYVSYARDRLRSAGILPVPLPEMFPQFGAKDVDECDRETARMVQEIRIKAEKMSRAFPVESVVLEGKNRFFEERDGTNALLKDIGISKGATFVKIGHESMFPISAPVIGPSTLKLCIRAGIKEIVVDDMISIAQPGDFWILVRSNNIRLKKLPK